MTDDPVYADEVADLLADVQAWMELQRLSGAQVLPTEALLPPSQRLPPRPPAGAGAPRRPVQAASPRPSRREADRPSGRPRPQRPQGRPPAPAPRSPPTPPRAERAPAPAQAPPAQPSLGRWAEWLSPPAGGASVSADPVLGSLETLSAVREHLGDCRRCGLCEGRNNLVFGVGSETARLAIVGEAPGAQEDRLGEPFVGPAGQMLDNMLERVLGLRRSDVYIANIIKCRPPGNRNPSPDEIARCRPFLNAQLRVIQPDLVLVLGSVAFRTLFDTSQGIKRNRGQWRDLAVGDRTVRAMPTFHPAYLLRQPGDKRLTFQDLQALRGALDALPPR